MSYRSVVSADNPLHWWRISSPGGALVYDIGSSVRHVFNPNNTQLPGYSGIAADGGSGFFPGNSNLPSVDNLPAQVSPISVEAWCWVMAATPPGGSQALFGWNGFNAGVELGLDATLHARFIGQVATIDPNPIPIQSWHHLVGTKDGAAEKIYVDGTLRNTIGNAVAMNFTAGLSIGAEGNATNFFRGWLCEVAAYSYALTAGQVAAHYAAREVSSPPVFFGTGTLTLATGSVLTDPTALAQILASVRKTY